MSKQPVTLIELNHAVHGGPLEVPGQLPRLAAGLDEALSDPEVREWIEASPLSELNHTRLRWLLMVLRSSKVYRDQPSPRRLSLTWRERITGRVQA